MDILDIDEVLKDDSFIFLEEKSQDDVSNILQQWKINNCIKQQPELAQEQAVFKLNSRTFTRPKRKTAQNLESQFSNFQTHTTNAFQQQQQMTNKSTAPMLNLEIGGLVTTMHKSFLQDTSPPSSICSSMDVSFDCMNNSLITSADFSNINFLQSTQSLDFHDRDMKVFDLAGKSTTEGYTLIDAIRDRKALESLTNSGDGTLIKDSHIAQIDDISLALSKTGSACSTMDNSTESVESNNRTVEIFKQPRLSAFNNNNNNNKNNNNNNNIKDDLISDTTFNLVENSMTVETATEEKEQEYENDREDRVPPISDVTQNLENHFDETFKKPTPLDETMLAVGKGNNSTFDCQLPLTPDARCETPEGADKRPPSLKMYESTPHTSHVRVYNKQQYTPTIKTAGDMNLSPIVAFSADGSQPCLNATRTLNDTFDRSRAERKYKMPTNATYVDADKFHDETFNKELQQLEKAAEDLSEMRSVMDMAQAEAALLNDGYDDEAQFERMLNQFDQVEMKEEQLKMKKSLETIKKRFNYGLEKSAHTPEKLTSPQECSAGADETFDKDTMNTTMNRTSSMKSTLGSMSSTTSPLATVPTLTNSTQSNSSNSGERLLNRRSRLYDDFVPSHQKHTPPSLGSTSFTVVSKSDNTTAGEEHRHETDELSTTMNMGATTTTKTEKEEQQQEQQQQFNEEAADETNATRTEPKRSIPQTKLFRTTDGVPPERERERERDRDRFKTILIDRKQRVQNEISAAVQTATADGVVDDGANGIIVPCIDSELASAEPAETEENTSAGGTVQRHSRRDTTITSNSSAELHDDVTETTSTKPRDSNVNPNFLTYKKLKDKPVGRVPAATRQVPDVVADVCGGMDKPKSRLEPRSLSRPRYISGLQKFSVVSKATSASDLEHSLNSNRDKKLNSTMNLPSESNGIAGKYQSNMSAFGRPQTGVAGARVGDAGGAAAGQSELKSPMGIKSKSFHNLSNNFGYQNGGGGGGGHATFTRPKNNFLGAAKKTTGDDKQNADDVFKVPNSKLVSGIRAPGGLAGNALAGAPGKRLARPSSGYYSLNPKGYAQHMNDAGDSDSGIRTGETPSNSSRCDGGMASQPIPSSLNTTATTKALASLTKLTTTGTGIPKPSGLRAPSNIKRSGLPKPATAVARR